MIFVFILFFFKQKTAYEMRISDWSSDVCSSDLHPNEIAQNQAHCDCAETGANWWMHNNFLVERSGKMSKSAGGFTTLQSLIDKGVHPLAYRLMCLSAHYRRELEFSGETLMASVTRQIGSASCRERVCQYV